MKLNFVVLVASLTAAVAFSAMPATARGKEIYVANLAAGTIGEYTTSGATVNAALVTELASNQPSFIAVSGSNLFVVNQYSNTIGEYNATTGATINASFITGLTAAGAIVVSGGNLFVTNGVTPYPTLADGTSTISEYDASTGAAINASLVTGLSSPYGMALSGNDLFVTNFNGGTIGEYTTSGATVNASLITGLGSTGAEGIAVSGSDLFVTNSDTGTIGEYTTSGATVNASLVTGLEGPVGIAVSGSDLFVTNYFNGTIGEYTTSGATVNASLVTGLSDPAGIVVMTPEPSTWGIFVIGAGTLLIFGIRKRRA